MAGERPCAYVNTSIVIRALNPTEPDHEKAEEILEECCRLCRCVYSSVHEYEMPPGRFEELDEYLTGIGGEFVGVDTDALEAQAVAIVRSRRLSEARVPDVMHMLAANALGCKYILARDRFIWRNAKYYGLEYVNWETHGGRCPCSSGSPSASGQAGTSRSGGRGSAGSRFSRTSQGTGEGRGRSSKTTRRARSPSKKPRESSGSSRKRRRPRPGRGGGSPPRGPRGSRGMTRAR